MNYLEVEIFQKNKIINGGNLAPRHLTIKNEPPNMRKKEETLQSKA